MDGFDKEQHTRRFLRRLDTLTKEGYIINTDFNEVTARVNADYKQRD
jgi:hypothetical protein